MKEIKLVEKRRSGTTTGYILKALGSAMASPGVDFELSEIYITRGMARNTRDTAKDLISSLGLKDITVSIVEGSVDYGITVRCEYCGFYIGDDGNTYRKITT